MPHIIDNKIYHQAQPIGRLDGEHVRDVGDNKLGYWQGNFIYNDAAQKIAYLENDALHFENGQPSIPFEKINGDIQGAYPINAKCAVKALLEY
jgi:hypothetical protein